MNIGIIGSGFIAAYIEKELILQGVSCKVYSSDIFNVCDVSTWESLCPETKIVILTAGSMSNNPNELKRINEDPVAPLCLFLRKATKVNRLIFLSSGAVYGEYDQETCHTTDCNPYSNYGRSKLIAERLIIDNWSKELNILRLYFPYGPDQKIPRLIPTLINKIKNSNPIYINNDNGPELTLTHVEDLATNLVNYFVKNCNESKIENLASPVKIKIKNLALELSERLKKKPIFQYKDRSTSNMISKPFPGVWRQSELFTGIV